MKLTFAVVVSTFLLSASARTITVVNKCPFTIWPGLYTDPSSPGKPNHPTGWEAKSGSRVSFSVPDNWKSGRIWGRRNCNFGSNPGPNSCATGGCNGGLLCVNPGVPPTSLAEWTLTAAGNKDFYDVSLVDGFDLPMSITNNKGCPVADCSRDLNANCPPQLRGPVDSRGAVLGCKSACIANLDGNQQNSANCCSGSHNTPQTCPSSGVQFYSYFKNACPNAYAYAYDDATSLKSCDAGKKADYTLTFCP
ncbi:thaumatin [Pyrrhoderma noxium]|uniref:Thaumatin n=1 Tax=Pyrrhoderma noxium TaxID=2282107 RepID=A0A286UFK2_9AGAM|nr:thaumatin [Pyrrhoderma noxium]